MRHTESGAYKKWETRSETGGSGTDSGTHGVGHTGSGTHTELDIYGAEHTRSGTEWDTDGVEYTGIVTHTE